MTLQQGGAFVLAAVFLLLGAQARADEESASGQKITGCVSRLSGLLYSVQEGDSPRRPCQGRNRYGQQISWSVQGPPGPQGEQGPPGAQGPQGPAGSSGSGASKFVYVGPSGPVSPASGLVGMNQACADAVSGSRMCTSEEIMEAPSVSSGSQWVRPSVVAVQTVDDGTGSQVVVAIDASGFEAPIEELACGGAPSGVSSGVVVPWSSMDGHGMVIIGRADGSGTFSVTGCQLTNVAAACCAPPE